MLHPQRVHPDLRARATQARCGAPLDPINFFNIHWRKPDNLDEVNYMVVPRALTGVEAEIVVLIAKDFPTGSHKVGPAYSVVIEKYLQGQIAPHKHTLVFPSTGNYGRHPRPAQN